MECFEEIKINSKEKKVIPGDIFDELINKKYDLIKWWNYHHMFYAHDDEIIEIYFKLCNKCLNYDYYECQDCEVNYKIIEEIELKHNNKKYTTNDKHQMYHLYSKFKHYNSVEEYIIE